MSFWSCATSCARAAGPHRVRARKHPTATPISRRMVLPPFIGDRFYFLGHLKRVKRLSGVADVQDSGMLCQAVWAWGFNRHRAIPDAAPDHPPPGSVMWSPLRPRTVRGTWSAWVGSQPLYHGAPTGLGPGASRNSIPGNSLASHRDRNKSPSRWAGVLGQWIDRNPFNVSNSVRGQPEFVICTIALEASGLTAFRCGAAPCWRSAVFASEQESLLTRREDKGYAPA
jgi:hypothetical protein